VTVNISNAVVYGDATFAATNMPFTTNYTAVASDSLGRRSTNTVSVSIAANNALFQYDGNGNLIYDGLRSFAYDDENQLIQVCVTNQWLSQFVYDGKMRRRIRQECAWQGGVWVQTNEVYYVYDGNVVVQERDVNNLPTTTYTRGLDLSGSLQGAGGIGGLLARTSQAYADAPLAGQSYYHSDGNGNVTMLINPSQAIVAKYLYDAFGNVLSKSGLLADANLYRFSSKEAHPNSGLVYYLCRYYDPNLQRWPNRDPLGELGFEVLPPAQPDVPEGAANAYWFVGNDPITRVDPLGLFNLQTAQGWKQLQDLLDRLQAAWNLAQKGQCPKNPCLSVGSVIVGLCNCLYSSNGDTAKIAYCLCLATPTDTDCENKMKHKLRKILHLK
jgi:RHS repeat-associated protein